MGIGDIKLEILLEIISLGMEALEHFKWAEMGPVLYLQPVLGVVECLE